ncbi:MAG: hypothetical protein QM756_18315 [Polyangiaceae bacterium]
MKIQRLSAGLLGLLWAALPRTVLAADAPGATPPAVPPPPATSEPAPPPAAAESAPPSAIASPQKPGLEPPAGRMNLFVPPSAPSVPRSYHMHDGFYLRASVGVGSLSSSIDDKSTTGYSLRGGGTSLHLNLLVGGSPSPGLAVGGALLGEGTASADLRSRR